MTGLRMIAAAGAIVFGAVAAMVVLRPDVVERRAHAWVVERAVRGAAAAMASADQIGNAALVGQFSSRLSARAESLRARLESGLAAEIAKRLESVCHYCPQADSMEVHIVAAVDSHASILERSSETAMAWARNHYSATVTALVRDLRVFSAINAVLFLLVLGASHLATTGPSPASTIALWLLLAATLIGIVGYLFAQNWLYTLLTGRFVGYGYALWVLAVFAAVLDWTLNRARASRALFHGVGSVFSGVS